MVRCGVTTRYQSKPCKRAAGWGTDHRGAGECKDHNPEKSAILAPLKKRVLELVGQGTYSLKAVADDIGVHPSTVFRWRQDDDEFHQAMSKKTAASDNLRCQAVEDQLFYRLMKGEASPVEMIFFLCNRQPGRWKHVQRVEHTGAAGAPIAHEVTHKAKLMNRIDQMISNRVTHASPN